MSKILRRPMFRGGPVDSRGTGITSGLMDGGRVGYNQGKLVLGGDLLKKNQPNLSTLANTRFSAGMPFAYELPAMNNQSIEEVGKVEDVETDDRGFLQKAYDMFNPSRETIEERLKERSDDMTTFDEKMENIGITTNQAAQNKALEDAEKIAVGGREDPDIENARIQQENYEKNLSTSNEPSATEISAQDLIRENAELFKELLGEGQKEKIKKARIGDASDYLLKFFEGTQKEGATVGSAAADVAGFATSRDSRTEKARAANEKVDQTATVLAINDYIAGKRSKEDIMKALSLAKARVSLTEGTLGDKILKAKGSGPVTVTVIRDVLRSEPEFSGKSVEEFDSTKADLSYEEGDENKIFIDVITKETFTYDKNKNKVRIY